MADSEVAAVKVFNFICGHGGYCPLSDLLKHPSPLAKKSSVNEVESWFRTQAESDPRFVLFRNLRGNVIGVRIDLKKRMCLQYFTTGSCRLKNPCKFWHICKGFVEGTCKGGCGFSHDFLDEDNIEKTKELGFESKPTHSVRSHVAGSLPQVCLRYLKNECTSQSCPYLHICADSVRGTSCECPLSHDFATPHNQIVLNNFGLSPSAKVDVVRCNVLVPNKQKSFEASGDPRSNGPVPNKPKSFEVLVHNEPAKSFGASFDPTTRGLVNELSSLSPTFERLFSPAMRLAERIAEAGAAAVQEVQKDTEDDSLPTKVLNYICSKGGFAELSDLLQHPSPLAKRFPGQQLAAKAWLQSQSKSDNSHWFVLVEASKGGVEGVRVGLRKTICVNYYRGGSCKSGSKCKFWHICKGYIEGKCKGDCARGQSHNFHDECNKEKTREAGLEAHPSGTVRKVIYWSLPHICLMYLSNECKSNRCPYLHICANAAQGSPCQCELSHLLGDSHNRGVLEGFGLTPSKTVKDEIVQCNILIPVPLGNSGGPFPPVPSQNVPHGNLVSQEQEQTQSSGKKSKGRRRKRKKNKKSNQQGNQQEDSGASEEEQSDSDNNEDKMKPDFYSNPKLWEGLSKGSAQQLGGQKTASASWEQSKNQKMAPRRESAEDEHGWSLKTNEPSEGNLIDFDSEEVAGGWQEVDASIDDLWSLNTEPLSQFDEMFLDDLLSPSSAASLSQDSTFFPSDPSSPTESNPKEPSVDRVFECLCKEYNCRVPFSVISARQDLFPPEFTDVSGWFRARNRKFMLAEKSDGEIEEVRVFFPKARVCFGKQGCKNPKCFRFHVCQHYLANNGKCPFGKKCTFSHGHDLVSPHNSKIAKQLKLSKFPQEQLRLLIASSLPEVCQDYNNQRSCRRGKNCLDIHVCKHFVMNRCKKKEKNCSFGHDSALATEHTKMVLAKYNLTKVPPKAIVRVLLVRQSPANHPPPVCQSPATPAANQPKTVEASRPQEGVSCPNICLDFLLGHCPREPLCESKHNDMPYLWQYRDLANGDKWKSFTQSENEDIERQFSDVNVADAIMKNVMISPPPTLLIHPGEGDVKVDFVEMKGETEFGTVPLRRLSTKSAVLPTDHALLTTWVWYWLDDGGVWREYGWGPLETVKQDQIESEFMQGRCLWLNFKLEGDIYRLFFRESPMYQKRISPPQPPYTKGVRRRPVFRSKTEIEKLQSPLELLIPIETEPAKPVTALSPGSLPPQWTSVPDTEEFNRVDLLPDSEQYKLVESLFRQSLSEHKATIDSIERVQNPFLWEKYRRKKELMEKKLMNKDCSVNEKLLFYRADHENIDTICEHNIDWRLDEDRAAAFGQGAYFTQEAAICNLYGNEDAASTRAMFLAEVLIGSYTQGEPAMKRPPPKGDATSKKELFDSCVDNVDKPTIFVLFNPDQYYPSFLVQYKMKVKKVC